MATTTEWTTSAAEKWLPLNRDSIAHDGSEVRVLARPQGRRSRALRARSWQDVESSHPPHRRGDLVFSQWARRDVAPAERKRDDGAGRRRRLPDDPTLPVRTLMQPPDLQAHAARGTGRHDGRKSCLASIAASITEFRPARRVSMANFRRIMQPPGRVASERTRPAPCPRYRRRRARGCGRGFGSGEIGGGSLSSIFGLSLGR